MCCCSGSGWILAKGSGGFNMRYPLFFFAGFSNDLRVLAVIFGL